MITLKVNPLTVIQEVYNLSQPLGIGFLHYTEDPLSAEDASKYIGNGTRISMDYVKGRACKFHATITEEGVVFDDEFWYDHSKEQLDLLISTLKTGIIST